MAQLANKYCVKSSIQVIFLDYIEWI